MRSVLNLISGISLREQNIHWLSKTSLQGQIKIKTYQQHNTITGDNFSFQDFPYRPLKKVKSEHLDETQNDASPSSDEDRPSKTPSFCTCGTDNHPTQETHSTKEHAPVGSTYSKEKNRQILQMYLKSREVRKALAQSLSEQRRMALLHQKFLATKQWVQTTQQTTTFTAFPRSNFEEDNFLPIQSNENDVTSTTSSSKSKSMVTELAQRCLEERLNASPLPNVETLTRKNRIGECFFTTIDVNFHFQFLEYYDNWLCIFLSTAAEQAHKFCYVNRACFKTVQKCH